MIEENDKLAKIAAHLTGNAQGEPGESVDPDDQINLPPVPRKPDSEYRSNIHYAIRKFNTEFVVSIEKPTLHDRVAMYHQLHEDLTVMLEEWNKNPQKIKKHFNATDKIGVMKARYIIVKLINKYLNAIENLEFQKAQALQMTPEQMQADIDKDLKEVADLEKQVKADDLKPLSVIKENKTTEDISDLDTNL